MRHTLVAFIVVIQLYAGVLAFQAPASDLQGRAASFVSALTQALSRRDRAAVADMIRFPATATIGGIGVPLRSRVEFLQLYDSVFTPDLRCMMDSGAAGTRVERGAVTFAQGRIRAEDVSGALKITRISVPPVTGKAPSSAKKTQEVVIQMGKRQFSGRLDGDGVDSYVITLRRGSVVQARIEQFPGRSAALHVVEQKTGRSLDRPALKTSDGQAPAPRIWSDTIREPGDYRFDVVRLAPYCAPSFTYLLTITVN